MTLLRDLRAGKALIEMPEAEFRAAWAEMSREEQEFIANEAQRLDRATEDPTPGHLARRLDPTIVQTPALDLIDQQMVRIRDSLLVMFERRAMMGEVIRGAMSDGLSVQQAIELAAEEVPDRGIQRLIVSMPPQEGKSLRISIYGMLWLLRQFPMLRIGIVSYDGGNAERFSRDIRNLIEVFDGSGGNPDLGLRLMRDQKAMSRWQLETGGSVYAIGIGGALTGRPLDLLLVDDPVKDWKAAESLIESQTAWDWWQTVGRTRLAPGAPAIIVATRWHQADLSGRMIAKQEEDALSGTSDFDHWHVVNISAEADFDPLTGSDPLGRQPGEFMVSARGRTIQDWQKTKHETAPKFWNALYQGQPAPDQGLILLREWWGRWDERIVKQEPDGTYRVPGWTLWQSWDMAFKATKDTDFVVGQLWARKGADSILIWQIRRRMSFTQTIDQFRKMSRLFPKSRGKYVEEKANGAAVIDSLKKEIPGIIASTPTASKEMRAHAASPFLRAGNIWLPTARMASLFPEIAWDPEELMDEASSFPKGTHDDQVDAFTQYVAEQYIEGGTASISTPQAQLPPTKAVERGSSNAKASRVAGPRRGSVQERLTNQARRG